MSSSNEKRKASQDDASEERAPKRQRGDWRDYPAAEVLTKYLPDFSPYPRRSGDDYPDFELLPRCYGEHGRIFWRNEGTVLNWAFLKFMQEVGWLATHLMLSPYTSHPIIDEANIRQTLDTIVHPKHWSNRCRTLANLLPGFPSPVEPETPKEKVLYAGKLKPRESKANEAYVKAYSEEQAKRKIIAETGEEDPDRLIRAAADAGVYYIDLGLCIGGFTGDLAADKSDYDEEKDEEERQNLFEYLRVVCRYGSRDLFDKLTSSDKTEIDESLGGPPFYSDLPALLEASVTCTGAAEFDKLFPQPPPEYRLDACAMIPYLHGYLMYMRTRWGGIENALTPGAAVILNAAVSAVLYSAYQNNKESDDEGKKGIGEPKDDEEKKNAAKPEASSEGKKNAYLECGTN